MSDERRKLWLRGGNATAIVFVHGFIGNYLETWGRFPELVLEDSELNHCDIMCWGYPSDFVKPFFHLPFIGRRLPTIPEIANALRTELMGDTDYVDLVLVAHSMGGLVVQKLLVEAGAPAAPNQSLLARIRCVLFYATPADGVQVNKVARFHPQLNELAASQEFVETLRSDWKARVTTDPKDPTRAYIPCTVVAGLEDNVVPFASVKSVFDQAETAPGSHTSLVKPDSRDDTSFQILKRDVMAHTWGDLIKKPGDIQKATSDVVRTATEVIYVTGSRSRDEQYFQAIEAKLKENPRVEYMRVLMGPLRRQQLKDHLLRVFGFRDPQDRTYGRQTLSVGMYTDLVRQPEVFLCGNERRCVALLPPLDGVGQYSTGRMFTQQKEVQAYRALVRDLYGRSTPLMNANAVEKLPVEPVPTLA